MPNLIEITGDDVALLGDADLRTLIGLLCEADYRSEGLSTKGITWGGHQDAADGGLDVIVRGNVTPPKSSFVPRSNTGIQVKVPDMPRSAILNEMMPKGVLQESIKTLIKNDGAYVIVSSKGSTTDTALKNRTDAMIEAVAGEDGHENIHLEFFDRGRIASWVRLHPSLILWVRNKIGRELTGWRPYENWAKSPGGIEEEYLLDDGLRLHDGTGSADDGMSASDGLLKLRSALSVPGTSLRLAGLSGVGKTRLAQAIFDERLGEQAINRTHAFYTDISDSPEPHPKVFAEQLMAEKRRAILIVDNCPPELHRRLTQVCTGGHSTVSLLTIEYDVRDDLPDETSVFRLEPASEEIITKLIKKRFTYISQVDAQTIASFSGGNARVAIALANTLEKGETLSGFRDEELFERLFKQRHNTNDSLLISAEACSLVYSFEGADADSEKSELTFLASLIEKSGLELYRDVNALMDRDLIQSRDVWRAVLPHAIANRLAKRALESIPKDTVNKSFLSSGSERLIKSFSRRLSYLHDSDAAILIVKDWLKEDGWIGEVIGNLNSFGMEVFRNVAPVSPRLTLGVIERASNSDKGTWFTSRDNSHYYSFVRILRHLAYDQELFDRSVKIMCRFALSEKPEENNNSIRDVLKSLFYIYLSGTHAPIETRVKIINELVDSESQEKRELGLLLLDATLEAWHFSSSHEFGFGARSRSFGFEPKLEKEIFHWYKTVIDICVRLALSEMSISEQARNVLSNNLRGLWTKGGMFDVLEDSINIIHAQKAWNSAWISVREIIRYDNKSFTADVLEKLHRIENLLKPEDLLDRARTYALNEKHHSFDLQDDSDDATTGWRKVEETTRKIGGEVAQNSEVLNILLPEIVSMNNIRLRSFGQGLADGCSNDRVLWDILCDQFQKTEPEKRTINVLLGFLSVCALSDPEFYQSTLDELVDDDLFGEWFVEFQITSAIDKRGLKRLSKAIDIGKTSISSYKFIAWGRTHDPISDEDLSVLLRKIISIDGGSDTAIEILSMRFHAFNGEKRVHSEILIKTALDILSKHEFSENRHNDSTSSSLATIVKVCLIGDDGISAARKICEHIVQAINECRIYVFNYGELLAALALVQPFVFLNVFLEDSSINKHRRSRIFSSDLERSNPLGQVSDDDLLNWCEVDPNKRYPLVISEIPSFIKLENSDRLKWSSIVYTILDKSTDLGAILEKLADVVNPMSYSGSLAVLLQNRLVLFEDLVKHDNAEIRAWAQGQCIAIQERISRNIEWDAQNNRIRNESFE